MMGKNVSDSNTPHLQIFVIFFGKKRYVGVKKIFSSRCHVEIYCCFDFCRSQCDHINYEIFESIKN